MQKITLFIVLAIAGCAAAMPLAAQVSDRQPAKKPLVVSVFNNGTQLPGSGVLGIFTLPVHPGVSVGTEFRYNHHSKNIWFQTARLGVFYHQYSQTALQLYSEAGYRRMIWRGTAAELRMGGGYLHSFPATEVFKLKDGAYERTLRFGRPQAMAGATLGLSYTVRAPNKPWRFFLDYQFFLQMPFAKQYVPLVPNTALHLGVAAPVLPF
ncbi:MAG: hypothetical protein U0U46_08185 [Saprospiraceae bacterium]|nr:hypothetical protein [Saprospiraceae bacterium]